MDEPVPVDREIPGQYPSKNCGCHFQEPYGFVPEADCPEHDTEQFMAFLRFATNRGAPSRNE